MSKDLSLLPSVIGYEFSGKTLMAEAMTHRSYSAERGLEYDNQRLEFLGDAVLQIIITEYLFHKYPHEDEGRLSKMRAAIARQSSLAKFAESWSLGEYVRMGRGEVQNGGCERVSTLCDAFEALVGAIRLDGGIESARDLVLPMMEEKFPDPIRLIAQINPKGMLQEYTQGLNRSVTPEYVIEKREGPEHDCTFRVSVIINGEIVGEGEGKSRKVAEMNAASAALKSLGNPATLNLELKVTNEV
ncbi:MAG: ribonuclease III [Victivallales bacterium]|nr:ribonuclease III [Victivallales bacterium]